MEMMRVPSSRGEWAMTTSRPASKPKVISRSSPYSARGACPPPLSTSGQCVRFQQCYALTGFLACGCQTPVKRHQRSGCDLADRKQVAIAKRFRRRQPGNRMDCRTEGRVKFKRLLPDSDSRILKPPVVHFPGFADGPHILAHHRGRCQQSQQAELREPAKEETVILLPGKPGPRGIGVHVVGPAQGKPHVQIRQIRRRTDSPCRDCPPRAYLSFKPVVPSRSAMAGAGTCSRWRR